MRNISKFSLALAVAWAFSLTTSRAQELLPQVEGFPINGGKFNGASVKAQPPLHQFESVANLGVFRTFGDSTGAVPTSDTTPLFTRGGACPPPNVLTPILAPDGHQLTCGEWNAVEGQVLVKCIRSGSLVVVHLSGLIPNGQYSAWVVTFKAPGFNPDPTLPNPPAANAVSAGPLGLQDGSENGFVADDDGEGEIVGVLPAGPMSLLHLVTFDGCLTDEVGFQVHIAYHIDGTTHGPTQGPPCTWAVQRIFDFHP